jgi:hypothetical protein
MAGKTSKEAIMGGKRRGGELGGKKGEEEGEPLSLHLGSQEGDEVFCKRREARPGQSKVEENVFRYWSSKTAKSLNA